VRNRTSRKREGGRAGGREGGKGLPHLDIVPHVTHGFFGGDQGVSVIVKLHLTGGKVSPGAPVVRLLLDYAGEGLGEREGGRKEVV